MKWEPLAGRFSDDPDERGDSQRKLKICEAFDVIRREKVLINFSKENCTCAGGRHFIGLEFLSTDSIATVLASKKHKVYDSTDVALISINKQPKPVKRGSFFTLGPLEKFKADPDLVFLFANPAQADRVLGLTSFEGAEPFIFYPATGICSIIPHTLAKNRPQINLISAFERKESKWSADELVLALPFSDFEKTVENIPKSGYGKL